MGNHQISPAHRVLLPQTHAKPLARKRCESPESTVLAKPQDPYPDPTPKYRPQQFVTYRKNAAIRANTCNHSCRCSIITTITEPKSAGPYNEDIDTESGV